MGRMKGFLKMGRFARSWTLVFAVLVSGSMLRGEDASPEEAAWFAGQWEVGPAPVEGFETIAGGEPNVSVIRYLEGSRIEREITLRGKLYVMRFDVKSFGGNFPWWGENGGNYVSKKVDEDSFILAPVGPMGKAEWDRGWLYKRVAAEK